MAEISKITLPSGTTYDLKDAEARERIAELEQWSDYLGVTTTALTDGATTNPITIDGESVTAKKGNIAIYSNKEFIFNGTKWNEFGDMSGLGSLAYKNSASGSYTPAGSVSQPTFSGTALTSTGNFTPAGSVAISTGTGSANYTPAGSVSQPTFSGNSLTSTGNYTPAGSVAISTGSGSANYTPAGSCSGGGVTLNTTKVNSITAVGTLPSCTLPTYTVNNEVLSITAGSFSAGTLPTKGGDTTVATSVKAFTQPTFTGTGVELKGAFTGTQGTVSVSGTPSGTVTKPTFTGTGVQLKGTFTGTQGSVSVSGTPAGTVTKPTFTGTAGTVSVS